MLDSNLHVHTRMVTPVGFTNKCATVIDMTEVKRGLNLKQIFSYSRVEIRQSALVSMMGYVVILILIFDWM